LNAAGETTELLHQSAVGSPLGRIAVAGRIIGSTGVDFAAMRVLGAYALVYVVRGGGRFADARGTRRTIRDGDLLLLFPEIAHAYGPVPGRRWDEIYIVFEGPVFDLWRRRGILSPAEPVQHLEPVSFWRRRLEDLLAADLSPLERVCRLQATLAQVLAQPTHDLSRARDAAWLERAQAALTSGLGNELDLTAAARGLGMSPETFRKRFVRLARIPPGRYRATALIEVACRLLHEGVLSLKEIAARLGFSDAFHFSRRFKQITGRTPSQYRALAARR